MCRPASFVITKGRTYWSKITESHEEIIQEFNLKHLDTDPPELVRVELTPTWQDFRLPVAEWEFTVDQDLLPEWWSAPWVEGCVREMAVDWLAAKVVLPGQIVQKLQGGDLLAVYGTVQQVLNGGTVQQVWDGGTVHQVWEGGTVQQVWEGGTVQQVLNGGEVQQVWDGGTVQQVLDGGTVIAYTKLDPAILKGPNAVLVDRSAPVVVCHTGKVVCSNINCSI